jgi:hypothetical protein
VEDGADGAGAVLDGAIDEAMDEVATLADAVGVTGKDDPGVKEGSLVTSGPSSLVESCESFAGTDEDAGAATDDDTEEGAVDSDCLAVTKMVEVISTTSVTSTVTTAAGSEVGDARTAVEEATGVG